jgi:hypothetical protein
VNRSQLLELRTLAEAEPFSRFHRQVLVLLADYQAAVADGVRLAGELGQWQTAAERFLKVIDGTDEVEVNATIAGIRQLAAGAGCDPCMPDPYVTLLKSQSASLEAELKKCRRLNVQLEERCARLAERGAAVPSAN